MDDRPMFRLAFLADATAAAVALKAARNASAAQAASAARPAFLDGARS
ncbi:hypothetical protein [Actinacidiphila yanglinensis]|nr:hypothetical protein [Actinacidiphila yanglinensis]